MPCAPRSRTASSASTATGRGSATTRSSPRIAREPGRHRLPADAGPLLELYRELYEATAAGSPPSSDAPSSRSATTPPTGCTPAAIRERRSALGRRHRLGRRVPRHRRARCCSTSGAAGKGYLVDLVSDAADRVRHPDARRRRERRPARPRGVPLRVALEHPLDPTKAIGVVELAAATEPSARAPIEPARVGRRSAPRDRRGRRACRPRGVIATWAIAPRRARTADGLATALFFDTAAGLAAALASVTTSECSPTGGSSARRPSPGSCSHDRIDAWLDRILGRVTMYGAGHHLPGRRSPSSRSCSSLLGQLDVARRSDSWPVAAVLLVVSYLAQRLRRAGLPHPAAAQLDRHHGAAAALHLPARRSTSIGLGGLALAGVVAVLAKYLLAVRGRHIFNPAAIGRVRRQRLTVPRRLQRRGGSARRSLLPFVAVGAFLDPVPHPAPAARRCRSSSSPTAQRRRSLTRSGRTFGRRARARPAVRRRSCSSPASCSTSRSRCRRAAGSSCSRRSWSALLFRSPFSFGIARRPRPQFALLVGNLLAFFFGQRRGIRLDFVGKPQLTPTSWEFEFRPHAPVRFTPGQYMELTAPARQDRRPRLAPRVQHRLGAAGGGPITVRHPAAGDVEQLQDGAARPRAGRPCLGTSVGGDFVLPKDATRRCCWSPAASASRRSSASSSTRPPAAEKRDIVLRLRDLAARRPRLRRRAARRPELQWSSCSRRAARRAARGLDVGGRGRLTGEQLPAARFRMPRRAHLPLGPPDWWAGLEKALRDAGCAASTPTCSSATEPARVDCVRRIAHFWKACTPCSRHRLGTVRSADHARAARRFDCSPPSRSSGTLMATAPTPASACKLRRRRPAPRPDRSRRALDVGALPTARATRRSPRRHRRTFDGALASACGQQGRPPPATQTAGRRRPRQAVVAHGRRPRSAYRSSCPLGHLRDAPARARGQRSRALVQQLARVCLRRLDVQRSDA